MQAMDDVTQTLLYPSENDSEKTLCFDSCETDTTEIASYMSIGTRNNQQDSVRFDHNEFSTVCVVCDGMGGLSGGERASALGGAGNDTASARKCTGDGYFHRDGPCGTETK